MQNPPQLGNVSVVSTLKDTSAVVGITIKFIFSLQYKNARTTHTQCRDRSIEIRVGLVGYLAKSLLLPGENVRFCL